MNPRLDMFKPIICPSCPNPHSSSHSESWFIDSWSGIWREWDTRSCGYAWFPCPSCCGMDTYPREGNISMVCRRGFWLWEKILWPENMGCMEEGLWEVLEVGGNESTVEVSGRESVAGYVWSWEEKGIDTANWLKNLGYLFTCQFVTGPRPALLYRSGRRPLIWGDSSIALASKYQPLHTHTTLFVCLLRLTTVILLVSGPYRD